MNPLLLIRIAPYAIGLLLLAIAATAFYKAGQDDRQADWDKSTAQQVAAQLAKNNADNAKLKTLEETKNENLVEIDRLRANNHAIWLRLPKTPCTGSAPSQDTTAGGGELPASTPSSAETAINEFDKRWADEAYRADRIVEDCRVLNNFVE